MLAVHPTTSSPEMEARNASEKLQRFMVKQGNMNLPQELIFKNIFVFRYMVEMFCLTVADPRISFPNFVTASPRRGASRCLFQLAVRALTW